MAALTIRNLEDDVKEGLRMRAAKNKRSMEAEVRAILGAVVKQAPVEPENLAVWLRRHFKGLEGPLPIPKRSLGRPPPDFR